MHVRILPELCVRLLKSEYYFPISILLSLIGCVRANRNIFTINFKKGFNHRCRNEPIFFKCDGFHQTYNVSSHYNVVKW